MRGCGAVTSTEKAEKGLAGLETVEELENIQGGQPGFQAWCRGVGGHQGRARRQLEVAMWVPWSGPEGRVWQSSAWVLAALVEGEVATGVLAGRGGARDGASTLGDSEEVGRAGLLGASGFQQ